MTKSKSIPRTIVRVALLAASTLALGACISIPQRAVANGEAMSSSRAYQARMSGDFSIQNGRRLETTLNPRRLNYSEVAYPAFGDWWY